MNEQRWNRVNEYAAEQHLDAMIITDPEDIGFLSGCFRGSALVVLPDQKFLFVDPPEAAEAHSRVVGCEVLSAEWAILSQYIGHLLGGLVPDRLGYSAGISQEMFLSLDRNVRHRGLCRQLVVMHGLRSKLRAVKDAPYLRQIRECCRMADAGYARLVRVIQEGVSEFDLAAEIESELRRAGCERYAFPTIVASGSRSAFPHALPTERRLRSGDLVVVDFGARQGSGVSDLSRTMVIGEANDEQKDIHETVRIAQEMAITSMAPGVEVDEVYRAAHRHIAAAGYAKYFVHGLGHSVGSGPDLSPGVSEILRPGHVLTVEPGIYIPDWGGVRIEDVVEVTEDGAQPLTHSPRLLLEA